ncbi:hypothetical protein QBC36DRAFT_348432 [Triangularia setosa]|uniref:Uncharacterized protein n=1 Tax=Triangularia setosa TaxID=2587417 RepID=A0AAN6W558_9PEZI|nr:hypothetical protein QBC36DRAFT_348432 [Podospora setosa]
MLMSRAFGTLLLGLATTVLGDKTLLSGPSAQVPLRDTSVKGYISVHGGPKKYKAMPESGRAAYSYTRPRRTARPANKQSIERPSRRPRRRRQNLEDEGDDTGSTQSVCQGRNGTITTCPAELGCCVSPTGEAACCPAAGVTCDESDCVQSTASIPPTAASTDLAIITVTQTSTSTVTSFAETRVVVVTSTQLLTFLNPTQRTATSTVIVTSFLRKAKRTVGRPAEITASQTPNTSAHTSSSGPKITSGSTRKYMGARAAAHKRQEATLTSTVVTTTTVFVPGITTRTLTNIVFSTTLAAPNAATTVFVTTTVFRPSTSTTAIPGVTLPVNPSPSEPTSSSVIDSEAPTSLSPTDLAEPTGLLPTNTASLASTSLSTPTATTSSSSTDVTTSTPSTSSPTETETAAILPEGTMMETMSSPPTTPTTTPIPNPFTPPQPALTPAKIAGLVLGIVLALLLFIALAFLLRRLVIRRRQAQAKLRQQLHSPRPDLAPPSMSGGNGGAPAPVVPTGPSSNGSSNISSGAYSGLTGEGEVRIVIRPAPKRRTQSSGVGEGVGMVNNNNNNRGGGIRYLWRSPPPRQKKKRNGVLLLRGGVWAITMMKRLARGLLGGLLPAC